MASLVSEQVAGLAWADVVQGRDFPWKGPLRLECLEISLDLVVVSRDPYTGGSEHLWGCCRGGIVEKSLQV